VLGGGDYTSRIL